MLDWFRTPRSPTPSRTSVAVQPPGAVFPWPRGTTLTALDEAVLALPRALVGPDEVIAAIIRGDDAMEITLAEDGELFYLRLRPGMTVSLTRSAQSFVVADDGQSRRFQISTPSAPAET